MDHKLVKKTINQITKKWSKGRRRNTSILQPKCTWKYKTFYKHLRRRHAYKNILIIPLYFTILVHYCQHHVFATLFLRNSLLSNPPLSLVEKARCTFTITEAQHLSYNLYKYPKTLYSGCCSNNVILNRCMFKTLYTQTYPLYSDTHA